MGVSVSEEFDTSPGAPVGKSRGPNSQKQLTNKANRARASQLLLGQWEASLPLVDMRFFFFFLNILSCE